jgi:hypothetical protein
VLAATTPTRLSREPVIRCAPARAPEVSGASRSSRNAIQP